MLFSFQRTDSLTLFRKLFYDYILPYKKILIVGILCMCLSALTTTLFAKYLKPIFDDIFTNHRKDLLFYIAISVLGIFFIKGFSEYGESLCMDYIGQKMVVNLQEKLFSHIITLDVSFFHQNHGGKLVSFLTNDINLLKNSILQSMTSMIKDSLTIFGLVGLMFYEDFRLALIAIIGLPLVAFPLIKCGKKIRKISFQTQEITASLYTFFHQVFHGICLVKASHREAFEVRALQKKMDVFFRKIFQTTKIKALVHPLMETLGGIAITVVIIYGGLQVINGQKTTGAFISFIAALLLMYRPLKNIIRLNNQLQEGLAAADRIFHILDQKPHIEKTLSFVSSDIQHEKKEKNLFQHCITFQDVGFSYPQAASPVFSKFNIVFPAKKKLALVGSSGAGKTTLFYLLLRFYQPEHGMILIDHKDIKSIDLLRLRKNISLVSQDIVLFDDTIFNNIAYGIPEASLAQVREAASLSYADEFIETLPEKYETFVGENGVRLSGGQRQRIALARAFVKNAPLLLLDEATAALDTVSEKKVQKALFRLMENRTTIIIAHRLSTIESADHIFVMQQGKIIEHGSHDTLFSCKGTYYYLLKAQAGGFF